MPEACAVGREQRIDEAAAPRSVRWHAPLLIAVCALLFLAGLASLPLTDPEEARCAQIVREMIRSGDWLVPHLQAISYYDKPAPFFWLAAAGELLTGNAALGGRLPAALAAAAAVLATYVLGRRMFGPSAGLIAGVALATAGEFWYMARWYRMDMPFAAAMWAALAWFWHWHGSAQVLTRLRSAVAWSGFYFFCGIATLMKGPAGLGIPVLIVGAYFLMRREYRGIAQILNVGGIAVFAVVVVPWYAAVWLREPAYLYEFLVRQNLMRFGTTTFGHSWPGILFVPILLAGLLPWTLYLPAAVLRCLPGRARGRDEAPQTLLLASAALVPLTFFSFSGTKIAGYILPCLPPIAVLIGAVLADWIETGREERQLDRAAVAFIGVFVLLWVAAAGVGVVLGGIGPWLAIPVLACVVVSGMMRRSLEQKRRAAFVAWAASGCVALFAFAGVHTEAVGYQRLSARSLAAQIPERDRGSAELYMWPSTRYSFVYYADLPQQADVQRFSATETERLVAALNAPRRAYVLVSGSKSLSELEARLGEQVHVVARDGDLALVANRAAHDTTAALSGSGTAGAPAGAKP